MRTISTLIAAAFCISAVSAAASDRIDWNQHAQNKTPHRVHFTNNCRYPIKVAVRYREMDGDWVTGGWWRFSPRESAYLKRSSTNRRVYTDNGVVYYYAETVRGPKITWSGDRRKQLGRQTLNMRRKEPSKNGSGDYTLKVKCDR